MASETDYEERLRAEMRRLAIDVADLLEYIATRPEDGFNFGRWLEAREKESE